MKNNRNLINEVLSDIAHDMSDEEVLKLLAESKVSENPEKQQKKDNSFGAKAADCYLPGWEIPKFRPEHFTND